MPGPSLRPAVDAEAFGSVVERVARFLGTGALPRLPVDLHHRLAAVERLRPEDLRFDPYTFTFLTLLLSLQASYAAPLILLAQNRQDDRDRVNMDQDRDQNSRLLADTEYLTREVASLRVSLGDVVTRDYLRAELRAFLDELDEDDERSASGRPPAGQAADEPSRGQAATPTRPRGEGKPAFGQAARADEAVATRGTRNTPDQDGRCPDLTRYRRRLSGRRSRGSNECPYTSRPIPADEEHVSTPVPTQRATMRKRIGEVLVEQGVITAEQLNDLLALQATTPGPRRRLGRLVVETGLADETSAGHGPGPAPCGCRWPTCPACASTPRSPASCRAPSPRRPASSILSAEPGEIPRIAVVDPTDVISLDEVRLHLRTRDIYVSVAVERDLRQALARVWSLASDSGAVSNLLDDFDAGDASATGADETPASESSADDAPIVRLVDMLIVDAVTQRASDIHVETQREGCASASASTACCAT